MKRWNPNAGRETENPAVDAFLSEVAKVCKRHGFAISHEDGHGAFEVVDFESGDEDWLAAAHDRTESKLGDMLVSRSRRFRSWLRTSVNQ